MTNILRMSTDALYPVVDFACLGWIVEQAHDSRGLGRLQDYMRGPTR